MIQLAAIIDSPAPVAAVPSGKGFAPATGSAAQGFARVLKNVSGRGDTAPDKGTAAAGKDAGNGGKGLVAGKVGEQGAAAGGASKVSAQQGPAGSASAKGGEAAMEGEMAPAMDDKMLEAELAAAEVAGQNQEAAARTAEGNTADPKGNSQGATAGNAATTAAVKNRADWQELKRRSLAAEAQESQAAAAAVPGEANGAQAAEKMAAGSAQGRSRGAERKEERSEAKSHAADAAKGAANPNAAFFAIGATVARADQVTADSATTPGTAGGAIDAAGFMSQPQNPAGAQAATAAGNDTAEQQAMVTPEQTAGKDNPQSGAQVMQQPVHTAFERASFYATGPAAPGAMNRLQQGAKSQVSAQGAETVPQTPQSAIPQDETAKGAAAGAQQTAVPQQGTAAQQAVATEAADRQAGEQQSQQVQVKAEQGEKVAQGKNEPRTLEGHHRLHVVEKGAAEQEGATVKLASDGTSGATGAPAVQGGKSSSVQGFAGQNGSGNAGHNGHPGQNAQGNEQLQAAMMGLQTPTAPEAPQPEAKGATVKTALHESILAQVKDGVVTRHADGNSQISIRLNPEELGELKIHVRMEDNRLKVEVQSDNRAVKDLLMSNLDSLKDALSAKNFTMEGFDVSSGGGGFNSPLNEQKGNPQQSMPRFGKGGGYSEPVERQVKYVTADTDSTLSVRF